ncbi:hypothetical protein HDU97_007387 [Phlyctochytrium planicorne]|nr:hypothetical protein HDU97_007387 [Phlyctochytrium planicorne]
MQSGEDNILSPCCVLSYDKERKQILANDPDQLQSLWNARQLRSHCFKVFFEAFDDCKPCHRDRLIYAFTSQVFTVKSPRPIGGNRKPGFLEFCGEDTADIMDYILDHALEPPPKPGKKGWLGAGGLIKFVVNCCNVVLRCHHQGLDAKDQMDDHVLRGMRRSGHLQIQGRIVIPAYLRDLRAVGNSDLQNRLKRKASTSSLDGDGTRFKVDYDDEANDQQRQISHPKKNAPSHPKSLGSQQHVTKDASGARRHQGSYPTSHGALSGHGNGYGGNYNPNYPPGMHLPFHPTSYSNYGPSNQGGSGHPRNFYSLDIPHQQPPSLLSSSSLLDRGKNYTIRSSSSRSSAFQPKQSPPPDKDAFIPRSSVDKKLATASALRCSVYETSPIVAVKNAAMVGVGLGGGADLASFGTQRTNVSLDAYTSSINVGFWKDSKSPLTRVKTPPPQATRPMVMVETDAAAAPGALPFASAKLPMTPDSPVVPKLDALRPLKEAMVVQPEAIASPTKPNTPDGPDDVAASSVSVSAEGGLPSFSAVLEFVEGARKSESPQRR